MPFVEVNAGIDGFRKFVMKGSGEPGHSLLILCDEEARENEIRLLENFHKISGEVFLLMPDYPLPEADETEFSRIIGMINAIPGKVDIVAMGKYAPYLVENHNGLANVEKVILINPSFRTSILPLMAGFEIPVLVVTSTPGNLDHDPDAVKYHDLISGSSIAYIRGIEGNPIYMRFTQSFNAIQRFLQND